MRATGAPHPVKIDFIKFTLDIKGKEDYILKNMSETVLPRDFCIEGINLNDVLQEVLEDEAVARYYDHALATLIRGAGGGCQISCTKTGDRVDTVDITIISGLEEETHIEISGNSFSVRGQDGEVMRFRSKLAIPPPPTLDTPKLLPLHSQGGSTLYFGLKRKQGRGVLGENIEIHRLVVVGGSFA